MKVGDRVKIYDIGPLAEVLKIQKDQLFLRLEGSEFWCPTSIIDTEE